MNQQAVKTKLKPLANRVLLQRQEADEMVKGGIILPETAKQKQETATVIAVGPGKADKSGQILPMPVKEGDVVLLDKYSGQEVSIDDEEYLVVRSDDIVAIIES